MVFRGRRGRVEYNRTGFGASRPGRSPPPGLPGAHHRQGGPRACPHINPGGSDLPGPYGALEEPAVLGALSLHRPRVRIPHALPGRVQSVAAWHACPASRRTGLKSRWIHQPAGPPHRAGKGARLPMGAPPPGSGTTQGPMGESAKPPPSQGGESGFKSRWDSQTSTGA